MPLVIRRGWGCCSWWHRIKPVFFLERWHTLTCKLCHFSGTSPNSPEVLCGSWWPWHSPPKGHSGLPCSGLASFILERANRGQDCVP